MRHHEILKGIEKSLQTKSYDNRLEYDRKRMYFPSPVAEDDKMMVSPKEMENETPEQEMMEYKEDFYNMSVGSIRAIMRNAQNILENLENPQVKENLTESWLQGKIAITEDYMRTIHDFLMYVSEAADTIKAADKPGLWENIRRKKEREGKNYKPAKPGDPDRPTPEQLKRAQSFEKSEADKPGPKDPRRTPAPKKDQKRGSDKNKPDSAKNPSGKITFSKEVTEQLSNKVAEHNKKGKGSKATLGMLKAVYRRGAGAYSTSHAPKMSRHGWAIARVNAFLTLLRTGKPANSAYTQDNDLLPKGHPRKAK